ncbi:Impact-like protein [Phytophthora cinnamomi]|uniref:Impact-like protein n=1 Tax=Phytophthora cinnamomi TaxID=4785 RepID=UPI00355A9E95|nr:Impact-like protein [Phytophthora cinnamomi]
MEDNAELQSEEIEVLQSIFEDDIQLKSDLDQPGVARSLTISVPGPHAIVLLVHLPRGYPSVDPPIAEVYESFGLTNAQRDEILENLAAIFERSSGQVCLYEWIEDVREKYANAILDAAAESDGSEEEGVAAVTRLDAVEYFESDSQTLRPRVRTAQLVRDVEREAVIAPLIVHGTTVVDRKSTFIAHACPVKCVEDVRSFLALLLDDRKIERAIHNMLAYRIIGDFTVKDNDEDGEHGAGSKLSNLLELLKAENVAVVVTRWYGGIKLGPDRFKHINACARQVLEGGGFLDEANLHHGSKKKNKR